MKFNSSPNIAGKIYNNIILFSLFINDLPNIINNGLTLLFADDTNFLFIGEKDKLPILELLVNDNMLKVTNWTKENDLSLNSEKTKIMFFGGLNFTNDLKLSIDGVTLQFVNSVKILGLTLDSNLTMEDHINNIVKSCSFRLKYLYSLRKFFSMHYLKLFGESLIFSIINYMCTVWGTAAGKLLKLIENVIRALSRTVLSVKKYDPIASYINNVLEWFLPQQLVEFKTLCMVYKIVQSDSSSYLKNQFHLRGETHNYCTRQVRNLAVSINP